MMADHLMLLDPKDLTKVRVECPTCRTAVSVDLGPDGHIARLGSCVGCGRELGSVAERKAATDLLQALRQWQHQAGSLGLRFEFSPMGHFGAGAGADRPPRA